MSSDRETVTEEESKPKEEDIEPSQAVSDDEGTDAEAETPAEEPIDELTQARQEAADFQDRYLRAVAELDNFRKRTVKTRSDTRDETLRDVLLQIAPLLDNLRRALEGDSDDAAAVRQGVEIIATQFKDILSGYGLEEIDAVGKPFDPNEHEAMMQVPTADHAPGTVMQEMERGYRLRDRVVRPARVIVSTELAPETQDGDNQDQETEEGQA